MPRKPRAQMRAEAAGVVVPDGRSVQFGLDGSYQTVGPGTDPTEPAVYRTVANTARFVVVEPDGASWFIDLTAGGWAYRWPELTAPASGSRLPLAQAAQVLALAGYQSDEADAGVEPVDHGPAT